MTTNTKPVTTKTKAFDVQMAADNMQDLMIIAVKTERQTDGKLGKVSNTLLELAKKHQKAATVGKASDNNSEQFITVCKEVETYIKSMSAGRNQVDKLPRCWTQAKSNIKAALEFGIKLSDYHSESALRKDVGKARKAAQGIDPVAASLAAFKKEIEALEPAIALDLMTQLTALAAQAIAQLVPVAPVKLATEAQETALEAAKLEANSKAA